MAILLNCFIKRISLLAISLSDMEKRLLLFVYRLKSVKPKASTLIETLVASVIIITIFTITSLTLNNIFSSTVKNNTDRIYNRINTIEYLFLNDKMVIPYQERFENWEIQLLKTTDNKHTLFLLEAKQSNPSAKKKGKHIIRKINYVPSP